MKNFFNGLTVAVAVAMLFAAGTRAQSNENNDYHDEITVVVGGTKAFGEPPKPNVDDKITVDPKDHRDIEITGTSVIDDPTQYPAILPITSPTTVDVKRRSGIGALYEIEGEFIEEDIPGVGPPPEPWKAWVQDTLFGGTLVLTAKVAVPHVSVADAGEGAPTLYCKTGEDNKGHVSFKLEDPPAGTYNWSVPAVDSDTLTGPDYQGSLTGIDPGIYTLTVTDGQEFSRQINFVVAGIELDGVANADFIGDSADERAVYATNKKTGGYVEIALKTDPAEITLPENLISWVGGNPGETQMTRKVSRAELIEAGEEVTATYCGTSEVKLTVYVFKGPPEPADANIDITVTQDDNIVPNYAFGVVDRGEIFSPQEEYKIYYKDKKWNFVFEEVSYEILWGVNSDNIVDRRDVPDPNADPFPLGLNNMDPNSTEEEKKSQAKEDLTPDAIGIPPRTHYWSSALTEQHEQFHVNDWIDNFYTPTIHDEDGFQEWIEEQEEDVTVDNLVPADVLQLKEPDFKSKLYDKTLEANSDYRENDGHELRAYGDGKDDYQDLADSIEP